MSRSHIKKQKDYQNKGLIIERCTILLACRVTYCKIIALSQMNLSF